MDMTEDSNLTYDEAVQLSLTVNWKVSPCNQGDSCWCRIIEPVEEIKDKDGEDIYIAASGCIPTVYAEYLVQLHNQHLTNAKSQ